MDPFKELSRDDLAKLRDLYRENNWPYGLEGYNLLSTLLSIPTLSEIFKFKFYSIEGDISHGMVAVSNSMEHYYEVYICPTSVPGLTAIEAALTKTNKIDWTRDVAVPSASTDTLNCLRRLCDKISLKVTYVNKVFKHFLENSTEPYKNLELPVHTYIKPLKEEHLDLVNRTWTFYSGQHTYEYFKGLMLNGLSYVMFSTEDNSPVCWIFVDYAGAFSHLYCVEAHRKKGYAEYITKFATNDLLSKGKCILAYTLEDNFKPQKLFNKLGFAFLGHVWWVNVTKVK